MSPELERMARAIEPLSWSQRDSGLRNHENDWRIDKSLRLARAALLAIREPSEGMEAASEAFDVYPHGSSTPSIAADFDTKWKLAIDHILGEKPD